MYDRGQNNNRDNCDDQARSVRGHGGPRRRRRRRRRFHLRISIVLVVRVISQRRDRRVIDIIRHGIRDRIRRVDHVIDCIFDGRCGGVIRRRCVVGGTIADVALARARDANAGRIGHALVGIGDLIASAVMMIMMMYGYIWGARERERKGENSRSVDK
jgi:hypothetical protein